MDQNVRKLQPIIVAFLQNHCFQTHTIQQNECGVYVADSS